MHGNGLNNHGIRQYNCTRRAAGKGTRSFSLALKEEVGLTSWVEAIRVGLWLAVLLEYNVFYATAVAVTSVSVFVALTQSCCVVVFLISINLLGEKATMGKLGAVVLCVAGVLLVSFVSNRQGDGKDTTTTTPFGLAMTLTCTVTQAVYYVGYKRQMNICGKAAAGGSASQLGSLFMLGIIGLTTALFLWYAHCFCFALAHVS